MNVKLLERIATWLENGAVEVDRFGNPIEFNMAVGVKSGHEDCGTACCIAGAAVQFVNPVMIQGYFENNEADFDWEGMTEMPWSSVQEAAWLYTGLDRQLASQLFEPQYHSNRSYLLEDYSDPVLAAKVIRNLIATGIVDWDIDIEDETKGNPKGTSKVVSKETSKEKPKVSSKGISKVTL